MVYVVLEMNVSCIPRKHGVYALVIELSRNVELNIGKLGRHGLLKGVYVYIGSARSRGGLFVRVKRHLRKLKTLRWHIDYLTVLSECNIRAVIYAITDDVEAESTISRILYRHPYFKPTIKRFGSSDKRDYTHLYRCIKDLDICINSLLQVFSKANMTPGICYATDLLTGVKEE